MAPTVNAVLETALYVKDLDRSVDFYRSLFDFAILTQGERICAMSVADRHVLLLFKQGGSTLPTRIPGGVIPPTDGSGNLHLAFSITSESVDPWRQRLTSLGIPIESTVKWGRGGTSLYFRDPDAHLIELVTPGTWAIY